MTMPDTGPPPDGTWAQVLLKLGAMGEDISGIKVRLENLPGLADRLHKVELALAENKGGRDLASRAIALIALVVTLAATAAAWVAVARR